MQERIIYKKFERERVDSYLASIYKSYSRSYFQKLINRQKVFVNDSSVFANYRLKHHDIVTFKFEEELCSSVVDAESKEMELNIIYEDEDIIIVNKQSNVVVHPSYGHLSGTLLNALISRADGKYNLYLVHRLDKDTSGLIIFAKNEKSKISISKQFQERTVKKTYYAAVKGTIIEEKGIIDAPLGRSLQNRKLVSVNSLAKKIAITEFKVIARRDGYTLIEVKIITGRTHQIRSHMKYINHPVVGDRHYGGPEVINGKKYERQMLHAYNIVFTHPKTSKIVNFTAELQSDIKELFKDDEKEF